MAEQQATTSGTASAGTTSTTDNPEQNIERLDYLFVQMNDLLSSARSKITKTDQNTNDIANVKALSTAVRVLWEDNERDRKTSYKESCHPKT